MRAAIDHVLDEPRWMLAVQSRLQVGQPSDYYDTHKSRRWRDGGITAEPNTTFLRGDMLISFKRMVNRVPAMFPPTSGASSREAQPVGK